MSFTLQLGGFEQHRTWVQSSWDKSRLRTKIPNFPVPVQQIYGYKIQVSTQSQSGSGFFAIIPAGSVAINQFEGYVEVVALATVVYSLAPVILELGLNPPIVQMEYQAGFYFPVVGEVLYNKGDNLTYYAQRGFWASTYLASLQIQPLQLPVVPPIVYVNGTAQPLNLGYSVNFSEGSVTFSSSQAGNTISVDYTYTIPDNVRNATIARTTWLLGQRALSKMGLTGLDTAHAGEQVAQRIRPPTRVSSFSQVMASTLLDPDTAQYLMPYISIAVA